MNEIRWRDRHWQVFSSAADCDAGKNQLGVGSFHNAPSVAVVFGGLIVNPAVSLSVIWALRQ
ncbi:MULTISPECIES: hypothetical protein [Microcoleus]|uniref:Uncharacterized protein n=1 Tax=Microcoleus anatoxicus PTRS2 TaxID=2705321 RepID=A0ABU8YQX9_9CYAN